MNIRLVLPAYAAVLAQLDASRAFSAHWSVADWQAELANPAAQVWCALQQEKPVGFIARRGAGGMYEITNMAVSVQHSRQGIGLSLLMQALAGSWQQITLEVSRNNLPAQALYAKAGLKVLGVRKQFYADGSDALIMGQQL